MNTRALALILSFVFLLQSAFAIAPPQVTVPVGVGNYVAITLTNPMSTTIPSGYQQVITLNNSKVHFPAGQFYGNIEFFYANGTIIKSWLESWTGPPSFNPTYWLKLPGLDAQGKMTIYVGFGDVSTNFYALNPGVAGVYYGIGSPHPSPSYDNGGAVFNYYTNFYGQSLPSGWASSNTAGAYANNQAYLINGSLYTTNPVFYSIGNIVEMNATYWQATNSYTGLTVSDTSSPQYGNAGADEESLLITGSGTGAMYAYISNGVGTGYDVASGVGVGITPTIGNPDRYLLGFNTTTVAESIDVPYTTSIWNPFISTYAGKMMYLILGYFEGAGSGGTNGNKMYVNWIRVRDYLMGQYMMPSVNQSNVIEPRNITISPTTATADLGSAIVFSAAVRNVTPYDVYKWYDGGAQICIGSTSICTYTVAGSPGVHHITFNLTDQYTTTSVKMSMTVNPMLNISATTPSTQTVITGNSATVANLGASAGTPPYVYQWLEQRPGSASYVAALDCVAPASLTCVFTTSVATAIGVYRFKLQTTDSATSSIRAISPAVSVYVNNGVTTTSTSTITTTMNTTASTTASPSTTSAAPTTQPTTSAASTSVQQGGGVGAGSGASGANSNSASNSTILIIGGIVVLIVVAAIAYYLGRMGTGTGKKK